MADITAANAVIMISAPLFLPVPQQLQGFSTDDIFDVEEVVSAEVSQGVDGILSGGMVFNPTPQTIMLQADSPSNAFFEAIDGAQQSNLAVLQLQANVTLTSVGRSFQCINGFLTRASRMPAVRRLVQPRRWRIEWQTVLPIPIGTGG